MAKKKSAIESQRYWERRMTERLSRADRSADELAALVAKHYQQALEEIQKEIAYYYSKATHADAVIQASQMRDMQRIVGLEQRIAGMVQSLGQKEVQMMGDSLRAHYTDQYEHVMYDVFNDIGLGSSWTLPNDNAINECLNFPWSGKNFSQRIWDSKARLMANLESTLTQGFIQGKSNQQMASEIKKAMEVGYDNAFRLVRTETNYIANQATMQGYKDAGLTEYRFSAHLDDRTSEICTELDNSRHKIADQVVGVNCPPMHPNCRSTTVPIVPEPDEEDYEYDMENMSFDEWLKKTSSPTQPSASSRVYDRKTWDAMHANNWPADDQLVEVSGVRYPKEEYKAYKAWTKNITKDERLAVKAYVSKGDPMNRYLRMDGKTRLGPERVEQVKAATRAMQKASFHKDMVVGRGMSSEGLSALLGGSLDTDLSKFADMVVSDKAFLSTSILKGYNSEVKCKIFIPKGAKAAYIAPNAKFKFEQEVLIGPNSKLVIKEIFKEGNEWRVYMELLV